MSAPIERGDGFPSSEPRSASASLPRISVVVPSYNQGHFLPEALESIFRQNYPALEVVVIDGGSTDNSLDVIRSYASRLKHWQSERDDGQSSAINAGMTHCQGDLVAWLNSDDFYWGDALWTVGRAWTEYPHRGLYIGNGLRFEQRTRQYTPFLPRHVALNRLALRDGLDYILQPSTFFSRAAWESVGGLDTTLNFCMDWDIFLRIGQQYPAVVINEFLGVSREYQATKTRSGKTTRGIEIVRMIQRHAKTELTAGSLNYLLATILDAMHEDLSGELREHLTQSLFDTARSVLRDFGDGHWSPVHGDPQDEVYLPFARAGQVQPPPRAVAPPAPSVSVVVPSGDDLDALERTLTSVLNQDYPHLEILVVDTGSIGDAGQLRRRYGDRVAWCDCSAKRGAAHIVNRGLRAARGEVLNWLNPGDQLAIGALRAAAETLADDPKLGMVYGNAVFIDPQNRLTLVDVPPYRNSLWIGELGPLGRPPCRSGMWIGDWEPLGSLPVYGEKECYAVPQPTLYFRREVLEACGGLNESYHHIFDFEFVVRAAKRMPIRKIERTQALVRIGAKETCERWNSIRIEFYRFSRPHWPSVFSRDFAETLSVFMAGIVRRKFGAHPRDLRSWIGYTLATLSAVTRLGNPERWWADRLATPASGTPPVALPLPALGIRPALPLVKQAKPIPRPETAGREETATTKAA